MKKRLFKLLSLCSACAFGLTSIPVYAYDYKLDAQGNSIEEEVYDSFKDEDGIRETSVYAKIGSQFEVTIPKVIVLDGATKKASYNIHVTGDIAGYETIYVIPDETFLLYTKNKPEEDASVSQDKLEWTFDDLNEDATGYVYSDTITAGRWCGTFYFNISLNESQVLGDIIVPEYIDLDDDYRLLLSKIQQEPGLYDEDGELLIPYDELVETYGFDPEYDNEVTFVPTTGSESETSAGSGGETPIYGGGVRTVTYIIDEETGESVPVTGGGSYTPKLTGTGSNSATYIINKYFPGTAYVSLPSTVTKIGSGSFAGTSIKYIYLPETITSIGDYAFGDTKIQLGSLPGGTTYIGRSIYYNSPASDITYGNTKVVPITVDLENNDKVGLTLEKGYKYQITALYNFYNDVTNESTIKSSNPSIVKFTPDCFLDAVDCGTATISGTYFTKDGRQKEASLVITVVEGDGSLYGNHVSNKPKTNEVKTDKLVITETEQTTAQHVGDMGLKVGNETAVQVEFSGNDISSQIKLISENENVAKIIKNKIYAVGEGDTKVKIQYTFKKQISKTEIRTITNEYYYTVSVKGFAIKSVTNDYNNISQLASDYIKSNIGTYLDQKISIGGSVLTCDIYRVADKSVLTSDMFLDCRSVDADTQIIVGKDLTVAAGTTLTPPYRCKGIFVLDGGTFTNNGTVSMTARGAKGAGVDIPLVGSYQIDAVGGSQNASASGLSCAGGGSGGIAGGKGYSYGGAGTSFSGGAGGGGATSSTNGSPGSSTGGAGGAGANLDISRGGYDTAFGGGAGNDGGRGYAYHSYSYKVSAESGQSGTGGLCVIVAKSIVSDGIFLSQGSKGGNSSVPYTSPASGWSAAGGSSGGGCIVLIAEQSNITGTHNVNGGVAATAYGGKYRANGKPGGTGTYKIITVDKVF